MCSTFLSYGQSPKLIPGDSLTGHILHLGVPVTNVFLGSVQSGYNEWHLTFLSSICSLKVQNDMFMIAVSDWSSISTVNKTSPHVLIRTKFK